MAVQIANVGATPHDNYRDMYQDLTLGWILDNPDKTGNLRNLLWDDGTRHDYIDLNEGRDFLKESRKYDIVILHNLYHPTSGEAPRHEGFYGVSPQHNIATWRRRLAATGATVIAALGDFAYPEIRDIPGYKTYQDKGVRTYYVKEGAARKATSSNDPIENERAKDRHDRINAAKQEQEYLLPNLHTAIPAQYMKEVPWDGSEMVTVWRSIPPNAKDAQIRPGDWVALTRSYAQIHGRGKLVSKRVPAMHVFWAGTDMNEWFYTPVTGKKLANDLALKISKRYAAIIEPPPRMVEQLTDLVTRYWAAQKYAATGESFYQEVAPTMRISASVAAQHLVQATLKPNSKRVIDAFIKKQPFEGKILETDGRSLSINVQRCASRE